MVRRKLGAKGKELLLPYMTMLVLSFGQRFLLSWLFLLLVSAIISPDYIVDGAPSGRYSLLLSHFHHQPTSFNNNKKRRTLSKGQQQYRNDICLPFLSKVRGGEIIELHSIQETEQMIANAQKDGKLIVLDFTAYNCPPCRMIAPYYEELSEEFQDSDVAFLKINVNDHPNVATQYNVDGWPTFLFIKDGEVLDSIVGGNAAKAGLYDMCIKYLK